MLPPPDSTLAATSIPSITELRKLLDYGNPDLPRYRAFHDDLRVFRGKILTDCGQLGSQAYEWKSRETQHALDQITKAFLDGNGNGLLYWPDDEASPNFNALQYSKDRTVIERLVKLLIFKINQQQFRNCKYKRKDRKRNKIVAGNNNDKNAPSKSHDKDESLIRAGVSAEDPIVLDLEPVDSEPSSRSAAHSFPSAPSPKDRPTTKPVQAVSHTLKTVDTTILSKNLRKRLATTSQKPPAKRSKSSPHDKAPSVMTSAIFESAVNHHHNKQPPTARDGDGTVRREIHPDSPGRGVVNSQAIPVQSAHIGQDNFSRCAHCSDETTITAGNLMRVTHTSLLSSPTTTEPVMNSTGAVRDTTRDVEGVKPRIQVDYLLIMSRAPLEYKSWKPKGSLRELSLAQLTEQLPFCDGLQALNFSFRGPGVRMKEQILCGDETGFETLKRRLNELVGRSLSRHVDLKPVFEIKIDLSGEQAEASDGEDNGFDFL